ncbi:MAG: PP2C family protein-serine/threonine phosphatase [Ignavibacteriota bacterium]
MRTFTVPNTHLHPELDYHAFCQCAYEYSGNFYDFIQTGDDALTISFGDLPSTGEAQSINIPCMQALVRGLTAGRQDDLAGLAHELNGILHLLGPRNLCAPWFYARVEPGRHRMQYVSAGHEPPLLVRGNGAVARLERTGAALGLSTRGVHRQESIAIEPGDVLAIFSEAVPEQAVLEAMRSHPDAGSAELTRLVLDGAQSTAEDRTFAAIRVVGACRHPLMDEHATEPLVLCAA